jgi:hypothetical protein
MNSQGIYILANDRVLELAIALLNSIRVVDSTLPMCLIPFDDDSVQVKRYAARFGVAIYDDRDLLLQFDDLSRRLHGKVIGQYRKLAAWFGDFEEFVFIDVDTVLLISLRNTLSLLNEFDYVAGHSDFPWIRRWTWRDSAYGESGLTRAQIDYAANTGFFVSRRGLFSLEHLHERIAFAGRIRNHMELGAYEQSFFNLLVVTSGCRYTSLSLLAQVRGDRIPCECWAGDEKWSIGANHTLLYESTPKIVLFIHWAGCWWPDPKQRRVESVLRFLGCNIRQTNVRKRMRLAPIWRHYRSLKQPGERWHSGSQL